MSESTVSISELHRNALCLDATAPFITPRTVERHLDDLRTGGVDAVLATVASIEDARHAMGQIGSWLELDRSGRLPVRLARTVEEMRQAKRDGLLAVVMHFQGTDPIERDIDLLDAYAQLGVRVFQLTYNSRNLVGDGCLESGNGGLSDFGRRVVRRITDLNMLPDISHVGERTSLEAIDAAGGPVLATHANARALCDSPRNLTDEVARSVVASGGMIGLVAFPAFVTTDYAAATLDDFLNHADYYSTLLGPEHIGLGFDFSQADDESYDYFGYDERWYPRPPWVYPRGIRTWADMPNVTRGLRGRGFSDGEIVGILGENFLRVFAAAWGA
jgi:membrane dipeptidase